MGETLYSLTYSLEAVISAKIGVPSPTVLNFKAFSNKDELRVNLDLLEERWELAVIRETKYKQAATRYYNKKFGVHSSKSAI